MQHNITFSAAQVVNQVSYKNAILKKEANQKILIFVAILACLVAAVNI